MNSPVNVQTFVKSVVSKVSASLSSVSWRARMLACRVLGACSQALSTPPATLQVLNVFRTVISVVSTRHWKATCANDLRGTPHRVVASTDLFLPLRAAVAHAAKFVCRSGNWWVGMFSCKNSKWKILMSSHHGEVVCLVGCRSASVNEHAQCHRNQ